MSTGYDHGYVTHLPDTVMEPNRDSPSNDEERNLALLPALLYIALMIVIGVSGNLVVCYVYGFKLRVSVTKQFILVLAALDLANCLLCAPTEMVIVFKIVSFDVPIVCKLSRFLTYSLNGATSLILLAIAVDRYCKVCKPLNIYFNRRRVRIFCIVAVVFSFCMAFPSLLLYGHKTVIINERENGTTCLIQDSYESTWWPLVFYTVFFMLFLMIAVTIISLYAIIAREIRDLRRRQDERISNSPVHRRISGYVESSDFSEIHLQDYQQHQKCGTDDNSNDSLLKPMSPRESMLRPPSPVHNHLKPPSPNEDGGRSPQRNNLQPKKLAQALLKELHNRKTAYKPGKSTLMLFLITLLFMMSFLPFFITAMIRGALREDFITSLSYTEVIIFNIFVRSYLLSNAANPIIYSFCNSRFRKECKKIFCRCLKSNRPDVRIEITDNTHSIL